MEYTKVRQDFEHPPSAFRIRTLDPENHILEPRATAYNEGKGVIGTVLGDLRLEGSWDLVTIQSGLGPYL